MDGRVDVAVLPAGEIAGAPEALSRRHLIDRLARMGAGALAVAMGGGGVVDVLAHASPAAASPAGGAHEQRRTHRHAAPRCQPVQGIGAQVHVAAPPVAARPGALDEPHTSEHVEVGDLTGVRATVEALVAGGRLEVDEDGRLVGVHGLVARPTAHLIEHAFGAAHTWCAFDAVGIPAALGIDSAAVTSCPACGTPLRVGVRHGVPEDDGRLRLWPPGGECTHLVDDFCRPANLYCDTSHLAAVVRPGTPGRAVTVTETAAMGRVTWDDVALVLGERRGDRS
jgi:Alkylmercury lyase